MRAKMKMVAAALGAFMLAGCVSVGPVVTDVTLRGNRLVVEKTTFQYNDFTGRITEKSRTVEEIGVVE